MRTQRLFWMAGIAAVLAMPACDRKETEAAKAAAERAVERTEEQAERMAGGARERAEATKERVEAGAEAARERIGREAEAAKAAAERAAESVERKAEAAVDDAKAAAQAAKDEAERREQAREDRGTPGGPGGTQLPTAAEQSEAEADRDLTRRIRRDLLDDDGLSMRAHNVQIITRNGVVTLRGEVASESERQALLERVRKSAGSARIIDYVTVD